MGDRIKRGHGDGEDIKRRLEYASIPALPHLDDYDPYHCCPHPNERFRFLVQETDVRIRVVVCVFCRGLSTGTRADGHVH